MSRATWTSSARCHLKALAAAAEASQEVLSSAAVSELLLHEAMETARAEHTPLVSEPARLVGSRIESCELHAQQPLEGLRHDTRAVQELAFTDDESAFLSETLQSPSVAEHQLAPVVGHASTDLVESSQRVDALADSQTTSIAPLEANEFLVAAKLLDALERGAAPRALQPAAVCIAHAAAPAVGTLRGAADPRRAARPHAVAHIAAELHPLHIRPQRLRRRPNQRPAAQRAARAPRGHRVSQCRDAQQSSAMETSGPTLQTGDLQPSSQWFASQQTHSLPVADINAYERTHFEDLPVSELQELHETSSFSGKAQQQSSALETVGPALQASSVQPATQSVAPEQTESLVSPVVDALQVTDFAGLPLAEQHALHEATCFADAAAQQSLAQETSAQTMQKGSVNAAAENFAEQQTASLALQPVVTFVTADRESGVASEVAPEERRAAASDLRAQRIEPTLKPREQLESAPSGAQVASCTSEQLVAKRDEQPAVGSLEQRPLHQLVSSEQVLLEEAVRDHLEEVAELSSAERIQESAVATIGTQREALASRAQQLEASMAAHSAESLEARAPAEGALQELDSQLEAAEFDALPELPTHEQLVRRSRPFSQADAAQRLESFSSSVTLAKSAEQTSALQQTATERAAAELLESTHAVATFASSPAETSVSSEREQLLVAPRPAQQAPESSSRTEALALTALDTDALGERVPLEAAREQLAAAHEEVTAAQLLLLLEQPSVERSRAEAVASPTVGPKSETLAAPTAETLELRAAETLVECERAIPIGSERGESEHVLGAQQTSAQQLQPAPREQHGDGRNSRSSRHSRAHSAPNRSCTRWTRRVLSVSTYSKRRCSRTRSCCLKRWPPKQQWAPLVPS